MLSDGLLLKLSLKINLSMLIYSCVQFVQWENSCPFIKVMLYWMGVINKWIGDHPCYPLS